mgnify:CR=1 FL=1
MRIILTFVAILLASCVSSGISPINDPSKPISMSGVSVLPPQDGGWYMMHLSTYQLVLSKKAKVLDESLAVNVSLFQIPTFESDEEFLAKIKKDRASEPATGRFKILENSEAIIKIKDTTCVEYHSVSEDANAKKVSSNQKPMLLENFGYNCIHPNNEKIGVNIEYSLRHYASSAYPELSNNSKMFFSNLEFTQF